MLGTHEEGTDYVASSHIHAAPGRAGTAAATWAAQPYTIEYYYKVQWGHQQHFLQLFLKNHYPLLQKNVKGGRMLSIKIESPTCHTPEDGRRIVRVTN